MDFSKLDLQGLQKARRELLANAKIVADPIAIQKTLELLDRLIRRAEGAGDAVQTPVRPPSR